ncbi:hypothetical protein [Georgenia wutianyii]|uniref:hypothetical protein n=1 Tax=Georgenia wutianyii TaxID=2585135 RepID=UPI00143DD7EB|nr:hypothetical protein [Georgenia wutianyii]
MDEDVIPQMLDKAARSRLRTLSKLNSDWVAVHLVMAGRTLDTDPELAYEHASAAVRRAGRVDVVREALALTAYATGRYAEALREVRTVRRLSGVDAHPAIEADCERGLGRPERALAVIAEAKGRELSIEEAVELTLVESGARADLGEHDAALLVIDKLLPRVREPEYRRRLMLVRADRLETLGRTDDAAEARAAAEAIAPQEEDDVVVLDLGDDDDEQATPASVAEADAPEDDEPEDDEPEDDEPEDDESEADESEADETDEVESEDDEAEDVSGVDELEAGEPDEVEPEDDELEEEAEEVEVEVVLVEDSAPDAAVVDVESVPEAEVVIEESVEIEESAPDAETVDVESDVEVVDADDAEEPQVDESAPEAEIVVEESEVEVVEESAVEAEETAEVTDAVEAEETAEVTDAVEGEETAEVTDAVEAEETTGPDTVEEDQESDNGSEQLDLFADGDLEDRR